MVLDRNSEEFLCTRRRLRGLSLLGRPFSMLDFCLHCRLRGLPLMPLFERVVLRSYRARQYIDILLRQPCLELPAKEKRKSRVFPSKVM